MTQQEYGAADTPKDAGGLAVPAVIVLGDAAALTRGSDDSGTESKQHPYD